MDKTAAIFCRQLATQVPAMFYNFYLVKNYKIANIPTTSEASEKICKYLELLEFNFFTDV